MANACILPSDTKHLSNWKAASWLHRLVYVKLTQVQLVAQDKQQIISSRTFGGYVQDIEILRAAVSTYMARAAEKLRTQGSAAGSVHVFVQTNPFRKIGGAAAQYQRGVTIQLPDPTDDTLRLVQWALVALNRIFKPGYDYRKAGVMLGNFSPASGGQRSL